MKGVIADCLTKMIAAKHGVSRLSEVFAAAQMKQQLFLPTENVPDADVMKLLGAACRTLAISETQAAEAFGEYWCVTYAPSMYSIYFGGASNAKQFLLQMKRVHEIVTRSIPNARPPVFEFLDTAPNKLTMRYSSPRNLQQIWRGCVKGVGTAFKEKLAIRIIDTNSLEITFG
jgi:hypothetical protein